MGMSRNCLRALSFRGDPSIRADALRAFRRGRRPYWRQSPLPAWDSTPQLSILLPAGSSDPRESIFYARPGTATMSRPSLTTRLYCRSHRLPSADSSAPSCFFCPPAVQFSTSAAAPAALSFVSNWRESAAPPVMLCSADRANLPRLREHFANMLRMADMNGGSRAGGCRPPRDRHTSRSSEPWRESDFGIHHLQTLIIQRLLEYLKC